MTTTVEAKVDSASAPNPRRALAVPWGVFHCTLAILGVCVLAIGSLRLTPVVGNYHDDGIYVSTAKALAEDGTYRLVNLPGTPLQTKYPILYPFLLSLLWKAWPAFPQNTVLLQLFSLSCAALALGIVCVHVVSIGYATRSQALLAYAICGSSPIFLYFSSQALSEPLFAALLAGLRVPKILTKSFPEILTTCR